MIKLTPLSKRSITEDWRKLFPSMGILIPMRLARQIGPLIQGICLDRDSSNERYYPTTHIHNLCSADTAISLSLAQCLLSTRSRSEDSIRVQFHASKYHDAARRLEAACLLPLAGDVSISRILEAFNRYTKMDFADSHFSIARFEDAVLLSVWSGDGKRAEKLLQSYLAEIVRWPDYIRQKLGGEQGVAKWEAKMRKAIEDPDAVRQTAEAEAKKLKVTELPMAQLICE